MKKMSNKKKKDILETALGLWTGICFCGWLCNVIECKDTEALLCAVAWSVGPAVILFLAGLWQVRKKNKAKKQAEKFIENWAKFEIKEDKAS